MNMIATPPAPVAPAPTPSAPPRDDGPWNEGIGGLVIIGIFFGVFGLWAAFAPLDAGVVANGEIKLSGNRVVLQHRDGGNISRINVREGDHVHRGQLLVELSNVELLAQENALTSQEIELEASHERLVAEGAGHRTFDAPAAWAALPEEYRPLADAVMTRQRAELATSSSATVTRVGVLGQRQRETGARIDGLQQQIVAVDAQTALVNQELEGLRALAADGYAAQTRVRAVEQRQQELVGQRAELEGQVAQSHEAIGETQLQSVSVRQDRATAIAEELRATDARLAEVAPRLQSIRVQLEQTRVRAPTDGRIVGLEFFNVGAVVRPGEKIMELVPDERRLIMEVRVHPVDADNVHPGAHALVRFTAFQGRRMPYAHGRIDRISPDRFEDQRTGQSYFLADVSVSPDELRVLAEAQGLRGELPLGPGLPVEVMVPMRKRTALEYMVEPLGQTLWRSFREN